MVGETEVVVATEADDRLASESVGDAVPVGDRWWCAAQSGAFERVQAGAEAAVEVGHQARS